MKYIRLALLVCSVTVISAQAATITYFLTEDGCTGTCGIGPYGSITLTDNGFGSVTVLETIAAGEGFIRTGAGEALEFNVGKLVTLSALTSGFTVGPSPATASTFGSFGYSVHCSGCGPGASAPLFGPLSFTVTADSGSLTIADFVANAGGYYFASDILGANGNTGNVAALAATAAPEPSSVLGALGGLLLTGYQLRRRNRV